MCSTSCDRKVGKVGKVLIVLRGYFLSFVKKALLSRSKNPVRLMLQGLAIASFNSSFIVSTTFPPLLKTFGLGAAYGLYTIAAAISIFFVALLLRETKGKELEKM